MGDLVRGRTGVDKYPRGVFDAMNVVPLIQGPIVKRDGSQFITECKSTATAVRLIEFRVAVSQSYILEFSDGLFRVLRDGALVLDGGSPLEVAVPYSGSELFEIQTAHSADVMYIVHPDHPPAKIIRISDTIWTYLTVPFASEVESEGNNGNSFERIFANGGATTGTGITFFSDAPIFKQELVGPTIILEAPQVPNGSENGSIVLTSIVSAFEAVGDFTDDVGLTDTRFDWYTQAFQANNYPRAVAFAEDRLWYGGTASRPQTIWGSQSGDFENFQTGDLATDAIELTPNLDGLDRIEWIKDLDVLTVGTQGGIVTIQASTSTAVLTPQDARALPRNNVGTAPNIPPLAIDSSILYVNRYSRRLHEFVFSYAEERYEAPDMTTLYPEVFETGVNDLAFQRDPHRVAWFVRGDGKLASFTFNRPESVAAWGLHELAGPGAFVESVAVVPTPNIDFDQVWMVVRRTIDGATVRYIEMLERPWSGELERDDARFLDCALPFLGSEITTTNVQVVPLVPPLSEVQFTIASHGLTSGEYVRFNSVPDIPNLEGKSFKVEIRDSDRFILLGDGDAFFSEVPAAGCTFLKGTDTFAGLTHLANERIDVLLDGRDWESVDVSVTGTFNTSRKAATVWAGYPYRAQFSTVRLDTGGRDGTSQGKSQRVDEVSLDLWESGRGIMVGPDFEAMDPVPPRDGFTIDDDYALRDGVVEFFPVEHGYEPATRVFVSHEAPLPMNIRAIYPQLATQDR